MTPTNGSTLSYLHGPSRATALVPRAHLFVAMSCATPLDAPSRHEIEDIDVVNIGRGHARAARRVTEAGTRRLTLSLADGHASSAHARLTRRDGGWIFEDLGSKNGSFVNGVSAAAIPLEDGDLVQIGQTLLVFRSALPTPEGAPADVEATARVPALATLIPRLAHELDGLAAVAASRVPILLVSDTGTGKEMLTRAVHALSRRRGELVAVNCGGLPATLAESALFGHRRGAFSGAIADQPGFFGAANEGTLLLDEVGDMPLAVQSTVLRALQESAIVPVGGTQPVRIDLRVVSATHHDLEARVAEGTFRDDLYARLAGFVFRLPRLAERREDLGLLIAMLLRSLADTAGARAPAVSPEAATLLFRHAWPRNVRELEKCLAQAMALAAGGRIETTHLPAPLREADPARPREALRDQTQARLVSLLEKSGGNISLAAEAMSTSRSQIHRWIKRYEIRLEAFRRSQP